MASVHIHTSTIKANELSGTSQVGKDGYIAAKVTGATSAPFILGKAFITSGPMRKYRPITIHVELSHASICPKDLRRDGGFKRKKGIKLIMI